MIKLKVNEYEDRTNVIMGLINNGYKVSVKEEPKETGYLGCSVGIDYWIIVEEPAKEVESNMGKLSDNCFPTIGTKNLKFKLKDGRILRGKYDFNDAADMRWIADDGNEYSSDLVDEWEFLES